MHGIAVTNQRTVIFWRMTTRSRPSRPQVAPTIDRAELFRTAEARFATHFQLERLVAADEVRALFVARHNVLKRRMALRVHFQPGTGSRQWFECESELLAAVDHPGIRRVYSAGYRDDWAYRTAKWIEGESLADAIDRGPRSIPQVLQLARDLLSALEHCHAQGIVLRRITPISLMLDLSGRAVATDLRWANRCLRFAAPDDDALAALFMAPEVRSGGAGEPTADIYTAAALLYYAVTATEPDPDPDAIPSPRTLRPACPRALERVIMHALRREPFDRYLTAEEMGNDLVSDLGSFEFEARVPPAVDADEEDPREWEKRLRRALGDDYELLRELGSGAFGRVYVVRDLALEREVALKVLHPSLTADPDVVERFRREAQLAASLNHPHIVDVFDIGGRAGLLWYTMAYVDGENLGQIVERDGPQPVDRVTQILLQSLSALEQAHAQGLVHRDLKPENLLIAREDGHVEITDFGLALAIHGRDATGVASRSGTPEFAAPEQLLGEPVDSRADLYALAAVGLYALTGSPPFGGGSVESILARQSIGQLPDVTAIRDDVSPELIDVLARAIARDPPARYPSADAFAADLRHAVRRPRMTPLRWLRRVLGGTG